MAQPDGERDVFFDLTPKMIEAATESLSDDGVFSDDWGGKLVDSVAVKHAIVAALKAGGYVVRIREAG